MRLLRYAIVQFSERLPRMASWVSNIDDVQVEILDLENTEQVPMGSPMTRGPVFMFQPDWQNPTRAMLAAATPCRVEALNEYEVAFDAQSRERAEEALRFVSASLALQAQVPCALFSPTPYLALEGKNAADKDLLAGKFRVRLPSQRSGVPLAGPGLEWPVDLSALIDRRDGVRLLGSAVSASHGVAKLHELFRMFEHAFAAAGSPLIDPLADFLGAHPWDLGYTREEVASWVNDLRHPSTHADLRRQDHFLMDHDVERQIVRIEQAAFDVLYNKRDWHTPRCEREERNTLRCAVDASGAQTVTDGARMKTQTGWDLHDSFPLRGHLDFPHQDQSEWGLLPARWHFSDHEHDLLRGLGVEGF